MMKIETFKAKQEIAELKNKLRGNVNIGDEFTLPCGLSVKAERRDIADYGYTMYPADNSKVYNFLYKEYMEV